MAWGWFVHSHYNFLLTQDPCLQQHLLLVRRAFETPSCMRWCRQGVRRNFELALEAAGKLGTLPQGLLSPAAAAAHGPDHRATVLLVAHLAAVLLAAAGEARALFCVQRARLQRASAQPGELCRLINISFRLL